MKRKSAWMILLCLPHLAALPGCVQFTPFHRPTTEATTRKNDDSQRAAFDVIDIKGPPKEGLRGVSTVNLQEQRSTSKMAIGSEKSGDSIQRTSGGPTIINWPLPKLDPTVSENGAAKKSGASSFGIVTIEPTDRVLAGPGISPLPQVEKKREDALRHAFLCFIERRHDEAIQHLRAYDKDTQEFLIRIFPALTLMAQKPFNDLSSQEIAILHDQVWGALLMLRPRCELLVTKACFCKEMRGFGMYKPLPDNHVFVAGASDRIGEEVQLYIELKNFLSIRGKDGTYLTKLACVLELHDSGGRKVWAQRTESTHPRQTQVHDLYRQCGFSVPAIPPGTYHLIVHIADETNPEHRRVATEKLIFRVAPGSN